MNINSCIFLFSCISLLVSLSANAGSFVIDADKVPVGTKLESDSCQINGSNAFTSAAGNTIVTDELSYSGSHSVKLTVNEGGKGFGGFGGIISFNNCFEDKAKLGSGDSVWVRLRMYIPEDFDFNLNGRNKFLRFRAYHMDGGRKVSEGYNDVYMDGRNLESISSTPFDFIFEGAQSWYTFGEPKDLKKGEWMTLEYSLTLGHKTVSEGGTSTVKFWVNGKLLGYTENRITLKTAESFVDSLYLFTYWDNKGAHKTQSLYIDDFFVTTDIPQDFDKDGNRMIGLGEGYAIPDLVRQCPVY